MKNVILLHGTGCSPESYWFPYLRKSLKDRGFTVWLPQLPNTDYPKIKEWLPFILKNGKFNNETIIVGHSAGCPTILSILENIKVKIKQAILVSGFIEKPNKNTDPILQSDYDWKKIKDHCGDFIFINSDDDPWGCNDIQGRKMFDKLGGILIIRHGEGHMGSDKFNQPYKQFPLILRLIKD